MTPQHGCEVECVKATFTCIQYPPCFSINNMLTYGTDCNRKRSTLRRRKKRRGSRRRSNDGRGKYLRIKQTAHPTTPVKIDNSDGPEIPNISRITPLRTVSELITSKTICKSCGGDLSFKSDSKMTQVTEFICDGCDAVLKLIPSKLVAVNNGRKKRVREHVVRQTLSCASNGGNYNQFKRQNSMSGIETIGKDQYHDILVNTLYETSKSLFEEHVTSTLKRKRDEFIEIYKLSNGGLAPGDNILTPLHVEGDARHQKCRGWNSFDGHFLAGLMGENIPIWIRSYHRPVVGKKRKITNWRGAAGSIDKAAGSELYKWAFENGCDIETFLHDNDAKAMELMRQKKQRLMKANPHKVFNICPCKGLDQYYRIDRKDFDDDGRPWPKDKKNIKPNESKKQKPPSKDRFKYIKKSTGPLKEVDNGVYITCTEGNICLGILEYLCLRHGLGHVTKDLNNSARSKLGKIKGAWHFLCGNKGAQYFKRAIGAIYKCCGDDVDEVVRCLKGLESHICNQHNNYFCKNIYKKCCSSASNGVEYSQTFIAITDDEISIVREFLSRWGTPNTVQKYINCYTTNYVEYANKIMLMFYSKAQFPKDPRTYDTAMYLMCLKLIHGWNYEKVLFEKMGLQLNDVQSQELSRRIKKSVAEKKYKNTQKAKDQRKKLRIGRLKQNKNYNRDYKNKADIKKHKQNDGEYKHTVTIKHLH